MKVIPVIDIRNGVAVRAVAGDRNRYQAINSCLTPGAEPSELLKALQEQFHCTSCYVADLDGIERQKINRCTIAEMTRTGVSLIVDAGATTREQVDDLLDIGVAQVVVASESLKKLETLEALVRSNVDSLIFSIDLKDGELLTGDPEWHGQPPLELAMEVQALGLSQFIILDLAAVGTGLGIPTLPLCQQIRQQSETSHLISGGGVHSASCVLQAEQANLDGLLIGSALHDGRLDPIVLAQLLRQCGISM